jgi:hypothetical protein
LPDIEGVETRVTIFLIFQDFLDTYTLFFRNIYIH